MSDNQAVGLSNLKNCFYFVSDLRFSPANRPPPNLNPLPRKTVQQLSIDCVRPQLFIILGHLKKGTLWKLLQLLWRYSGSLLFTSHSSTGGIDSIKNINGKNSL